MPLNLKSFLDWKYAIREVILIVVGITIAFALDNWNTSRNRHKIEIEILTELNETLKADVADLETNVMLLGKCNFGIQSIIEGFQNDLLFNDSLIIHFSMMNINTIFWRNDGPYEVLKSKGFDLISNERMRLKIIDLYSVKYRVIDYQETILPNLQSFSLLQDYLKTHFKKSEQPNFWDDYSLSIEPIDYEALKTDTEFRFLIEQVLFWNKRKIWFYNLTKEVILELQEDIEKEIN